MGDSSISSDLIRGHIDTIVLGLLDRQDRYGYEIVKEVAALSGGEYELKEPTLYSAFRRMEKQLLIRSHWGEESQGAVASTTRSPTRGAHRTNATWTTGSARAG